MKPKQSTKLKPLDQLNSSRVELESATNRSVDSILSANVQTSNPHKVGAEKLFIVEPNEDQMKTL